MNRRVRRRVMVVGVVATMTVGLSSAVASADDDAIGRFDAPQAGFSDPATTLADADPTEVGLDPARIDAMVDAAASYTETPADGDHPLYSGSVVLAAHHGRVVAKEAAGWSLRYAHSDGTELPEDEWIATGTDTIYDMASVSKLFTSIVVMQQVDAGRLDLDRPVAQYLPAFAANGKEDITVRQLLTHTSGLPAWLPLWRSHPTVEARIQATLEARLQSEPGTTYRYSDLNMITAGLVAEEVSGQTLDDLVREGITEPLGMVDTGYNPDPALLERIAATEYQAAPPRGLVHGEVHDENAWSLGGVAGHAGIFSTADDMAILAQTILNGGAYGDARILSTESVEAMLTDENTGFPGNAHGLGFELDQRWYMDALSSPSTAGHTGYTGTSLVIDLQSRSFVMLLTNRVHPSRSWGSVNPARRAVVHEFAASLAVSPQAGETAWHASRASNTTSTLTAKFAQWQPATVSFDLFVDTEGGYDVLTLEASHDDGETWAPVPFTAGRGEAQTPAPDGEISGYHDRLWYEAEANLPEHHGMVMLRWRYASDTLYNGRGVFVDDVQARSGDFVLLDGEKTPNRLHSDGWAQVTR